MSNARKLKVVIGESIRLVREIAASEAVRVLRGEVPRYPVNQVVEKGKGQAA
jgi:hypothetical protein